MGWLGSTVGWFCGNRFGGILGGLAGAVLGGIAESVIRGLAAEDEKPSSAPRGRRTAQRIAREREVIFLTAVGAMLANCRKRMAVSINRRLTPASGRSFASV